MHLPTFLTSVVFTAAAITAAHERRPGFNPISDRNKVLSSRTIASKRTFEATQAALEAAIPMINTTGIDLLREGRYVEAAAAFRALPALSRFIPTRDMGRLVDYYWNDTYPNTPRDKAVQWEIGNPYTASKLVGQAIETALYAPIRVILIQEWPSDTPMFFFDRPVSLFGHLKSKKTWAVVEGLDDQLSQLLLFAGGWPSRWPVPALP
ncbi:hypothetical protein V8F33_008205 [Rhypophila sp. PSN 637]